ncbi:transglutaminase domain-containing protein, partial [Flavobacterium sp.]|uniref:transglutaminase domain-containing protein n=1 Tax=Flavobacterium sp. TaxID=239 RepID=UPI0037B161F7
MKKTILVFTFLFSILGFGQTNVGYGLIDKKIDEIPINSTTSTDEIARYINANFRTENDKIRAVFYWTASNISYDVQNMYAINFNETSEKKIKKSLETRKGVCINYAEIFNEISNKVGVKSVVIEGYTKQNGSVANMAHAWCAAKIENKWYIFDPTWGSGGLYNGKFLKKINNYYFKAEPSKIIASHIPFDFLWQFLYYPITNQEFYDGKIQVNKLKKY